MPITIPSPEKVLLIDTDLRRGSLHKKLEIDNVVGLSNILVEDKYKWQDAVNQHKKYKNLYYITSGKNPPNPIKLLNSQKMKSLVKEISNSDEFDLIIFDCPPIIGLSDSLIVSEFSDGVILTVSINKLKKLLVKDSLQKLESASKVILGLVANTIKEPINMNKSTNKYYYDYQYQYNDYLNLDKEDNLKNNRTEINKFDKKNVEKTFIEKTLESLVKIKNKFLNWINE